MLLYNQLFIFNPKRKTSDFSTSAIIEFGSLVISVPFLHGVLSL